jgi:hypothetical protein
LISGGGLKFSIFFDPRRRRRLKNFQFFSGSRRRRLENVLFSVAAAEIFWQFFQKMPYFREIVG